jgi:FkbM family methyltransferase
MHFFGYLRTFRNWTLYYSKRSGRRHRDRVDPDAAEVLELRHRNGLRIAVRAGTSDFGVARAIFVKRVYFPAGLALPEDATVIDVGANIGCFTLQAARLAPRGRILAYEPEPGNFRLLAENLARNGLSHARAVECAVADAPGDAVLRRSAATGNTTMHSLYAGDGRTHAVKVVTLPAIVEEQKLDRIDYLKLDCEGAEPKILASAPDECLKRIRRLAVEVNRPDEMAGPLRRLRGLGFRELPSSAPELRFYVRDA